MTVVKTSVKRLEDQATPNEAKEDFEDKIDFKKKGQHDSRLQTSAQSVDALQTAL